MQVVWLKKTSPSPSKEGMLTPEQCRAARAWLDWSREDLAEKAGLSPGTVTGFELQTTEPKFKTVQLLRKALMAGGVEFIDDGVTSLDGGPGLRVRGKKR